LHDVTFLFTDIEGSTRLWEEQPERMRPALAAHDALVRETVERHRGQVVKMTGDGVHAAFEDALDAVEATIALQGGIVSIASEFGVPLWVRCGLHAGPAEGRDGDFYGNTVNRAARVMSAAHGGQMLLSEAVAQRLDGRLPPGTTLRDLGSVRLRDLARPERVIQLVHAALRDVFPALRSMESTPNNLPVQLTSFVGRAREITALRALLADNRLVSLVGLGGLGKTRLALQVAAESLGHYPDGVWLVELAPLQDPRRAPQAVAAAWGVKEEPSTPLEQTLARHARDRVSLLVLDNCEHMLEATAELVHRLLGVAPGLRVLVTSREPLRLTGEALFALGGLGVPGPREVLSPERLAQYEAVQLFTARAAAVMPGFSLDPAAAELVAAICHRLDGIPLAIELAAARVRAVSLAQIAERLKDRFRLLTTGDRAATPRQRTLRATIDWSHELLPEEERRLFRRLSLFAGGLTVAAAEDICAGEDIPADAVFDLLCRLVEKSLVAAAPVPDRYEMLETVREYAAQRLAEAGEADRFAERHFLHFVRVGHEARAGLAEGRGAASLASLDAERENLLGALAWSARSPHGEEALRLADALKFYWAHHGLLELGHRLTAEALAHPACEAPSALRAVGLFDLGQYRYFMGRYSEARESLEASVAIARRLDERATLARALQTLGMAAIGERQLSVARGALQEAVALAERGSDKRLLAGAVNALAMLLRVEGDFTASEPLYRRVVQLARESGDREAESVGQLNLSMLRAEAGDLPGAVEAVTVALHIARETGSHHATQSVLEVCAGLAAWRGDESLAARLFGAAESLAVRTGTKRDAADEAFLAPRVRRARESLGDDVFEAMAREGAAWSPETAAGQAREWLDAAKTLQDA
jgi:predicted ATPase/class 3 adenylate cyclase